MVKPYNLITFDGLKLTPVLYTHNSDTPAEINLDWKAGEEDADGFTPLYIDIPMSIRGFGMWNLLPLTTSMPTITPTNTGLKSTTQSSLSPIRQTLWKLTRERFHRRYPEGNQAQMEPLLS